MNCPHCNQVHPEGTKFCPETGERIVIHTHTVDSRRWSSLEEFENGDIIVDGVVLGKTTLSELRRQGREIDTVDYATGEESKLYNFDIPHGCSGIISRLTYKDLEGKESSYKTPSAFNKECALNLYNKVTGFDMALWDANGNPLLTFLGIEDNGDSSDEDDFVIDYSVIADNLEEHGYMRIESILVKDLEKRQ